MWYQNGIHLIDRSCWWTGSRVIAVKALIDSRFFEFSADDVAMALLQFENGVYSTLIHVWWRTGGSRFSTEFVCTDGMLQLRNGIHSGRNDLFIGRDGEWEQVEVSEDHDTTTRQLGAFVAAIDAGTEPPVTARIRPPPGGGTDGVHGVVPPRQRSGARSMNDTDLCYLSGVELRRLYERRELSPVEVTEVVLRRIEALDPKLNAFVTVTPERALAEARAAEAGLCQRCRSSASL